MFCAAGEAPAIDLGVPVASIMPLQVSHVLRCCSTVLVSVVIGFLYLVKAPDDTRVMKIVSKISTNAAAL